MTALHTNGGAGEPTVPLPLVGMMLVKCNRVKLPAVRPRVYAGALRHHRTLILALLITTYTSLHAFSTDTPRLQGQSLASSMIQPLSDLCHVREILDASSS